MLPDHPCHPDRNFILNHGAESYDIRLKLIDHLAQEFSLVFINHMKIQHFDLAKSFICICCKGIKAQVRQPHKAVESQNDFGAETSSARIFSNNNL